MLVGAWCLVGAWWRGYGVGVRRAGVRAVVPPAAAAACCCALPPASCLSCDAPSVRFAFRASLLRRKLYLTLIILPGLSQAAAPRRRPPLTGTPGRMAEADDAANAASPGAPLSGRQQATLIGTAGGQYVARTLSTNNPADAIDEVQRSGALHDPACEPLLGLLDHLGQPRAEVSCFARHA